MGVNEILTVNARILLLWVLLTEFPRVHKGRCFGCQSPLHYRSTRESSLVQTMLILTFWNLKIYYKWLQKDNFEFSIPKIVVRSRWWVSTKTKTDNLSSYFPDENGRSPRRLNFELEGHHQDWLSHAPLATEHDHLHVKITLRQIYLSVLTEVLASGLS